MLAIALLANNAKATYANAYLGMNQIIINYMGTFSPCKKEQVLAVTSMIIGAVAIARTIDNNQTIVQLLNACREEAGKILGGI